MTKQERYLLDTQACIEWAAGTLPRKAQAVLGKTNDVYYTDLSAWEVMIKRTYIKGGFTYLKFWAFVQEIGAHHLPFTRGDMDRYTEMPFFPEHPDPFDRMIVAQALHGNFTMVGGDRRFALYNGLKVLWK